ncbi:SulP family inorganic anion transporter [Mycoplana rhizolycopersici]|uniref:SulP family inorganic anion transporter n=1 Tax=Mycoplana rhizolycopersici TaxID=2746702 RepID=A0ABX2QH86_9HYPH|nr:SulP family inorganic anion transporter [Rhizobium rhizolycopersici]NVP57045.1 SulP family inorganic anion transporter [Rhizobium rhizolycopersici]
MSANFSLPLFRGLSGYRLDWLRNDISAGLSVAAVGLPSAIAYPAIAGLPPQTGIYASIVAPIAYAIFGVSRRLVVGPDAGTMTVLAAAMAAIIAEMPANTQVDRVTLASILALGVGIACLGASLLRLGVLATFLSRPILVGFFAGISISILIGQLGRLTGVKIEADGLIAPLVELAGKAALIHWPTVWLAAGMFLVLQAARAMKSPIPGPVIVVVLAVVLSALFDLRSHGIAVVGDIPSSLPSFSLPLVEGLPVDRIILGSAAIFLVSFGSGIVAARSFGARTGETVDANKELLGLGSAQAAAGFFGAFPISFSDSRTAINLSVGGHTQLVGLVSAGALLTTLLFLNDALRILPVAALAAILVSAALSLIDVHELRQVWRISRMEFVFALIAMSGAISFGVLNGVIIAIAATLVYLLRNMMYPRDAFLGRIPTHDGFYKLHRFPEAKGVPGLVVWMLQGNLLFFNTDFVRARLKEIAETMPADTRWFVLDAGAIAQMDSTAAAMLEDVRNDLQGRGVTLCFAQLHADAKALLERAGLIGQVGRSFVFEDLDDALQSFRVMEIENGAPRDK